MFQIPSLIVLFRFQRQDYVRIQREHVRATKRLGIRRVNVRAKSRFAEESQRIEIERLAENHFGVCKNEQWFGGACCSRVRRNAPFFVLAAAHACTFSCTRTCNCVPYRPYGTLPGNQFAERAKRLR